MAWSIPGDRIPHLSDCLRGGLSILRVRCTRCERRGAYDVRRAIAEFGDMTIRAFEEAKKIGADCPERYAPRDIDRCGLSCPDLTLLPYPKCYHCPDGKGGAQPRGIVEAVRREKAMREARKRGR